MNDVLERSKTFLMTGTDLTYTFKNLKKYSSVQIMLSWTGLNNTNGSVAYSQGINSVFSDVAALAVSLNSASGTGVMEDEDFGAEEIKLTITKGSITAGSVTAYLMAK